MSSGDLNEAGIIPEDVAPAAGIGCVDDVAKSGVRMG